MGAAPIQSELNLLNHLMTQDGPRAIETFVAPEFRVFCPSVESVTEFDCNLIIRSDFAFHKHLVVAASNRFVNEKF